MMPKVVLDDPTPNPTPVPTPTVTTEEPILDIKPPRARRKKRRRWVIVVILLIIVAGIAYLAYKFQHPNLPVSVQSGTALADAQSTKAPFAVFHPTGTLKLVEGSAKYDSNLQIATADIKLPDTDTTVSLSQQTVPDTITSPGKHHDDFVAALGKTKPLVTKAGTLLVVTNPDGKSSTVVLMSPPSVLFARASKPLTDSDWTDVFTNLSKS